jgi:hypothetical protein
MKPFLGQQLFVETRRLERDVEQGWIAQRQGPPGDEERVGRRVKIEGIILKSYLMENCDRVNELGRTWRAERTWRTHSCR